MQPRDSRGTSQTDHVGGQPRREGEEVAWGQQRRDRSEILAHPGSSRLIPAHPGSSRLISAHLGSSRAVDELDPVGDAVDGGVVPREPQPRGVDVDRDDVAARARKLDGVACPQTERPLRLGATSHLRRSALVDGLAQRLEAPSLGRCSRAALL